MNVAYQRRAYRVSAIHWPEGQVSAQPMYDFITHHRGQTRYMSGCRDGRFYLFAGRGAAVGWAPNDELVVYPGCWLVIDRGRWRVCTVEDFERDYVAALP